MGNKSRLWPKWRRTQCGLSRRPNLATYKNIIKNRIFYTRVEVSHHVVRVSGDVPFSEPRRRVSARATPPSPQEKGASSPLYFPRASPEPPDTPRGPEVTLLVQAVPPKPQNNALQYSHPANKSLVTS